MALLETFGLAVSYGGLRALDDVNLAVDAGQLVGLIGPNGAGKTTFIDALTGFAPSVGGIRFADRDIAGLAAHQRARLGLGRTWQSVELFNDLDVAENLQVAAEHQSATGFLLDLVRPRRARDTSAVERALTALDLEDLRTRAPSDLSHGQRKLVGVARALTAEPQLVCMDEPAAGLDTGESRVLGAQLRRLVDNGLAILLVDHDMSLVLSVCDYLYVIEFGKIIAQGAPAEVRADQRVIAAYLGEARPTDPSSGASP
ncbi:MAG: ABC transporter ATP-binding protein [Acidimicrobiia bacterium]